MLLFQLACEVEKLIIGPHFSTGEYDPCGVAFRARETAPPGTQPLSKLKSLCITEYESEPDKGFSLQSVVNSFFSLPSLVTFEGHWCREYQGISRFQLCLPSGISSITNFKIESSVSNHWWIQTLILVFKALESFDIEHRAMTDDEADKCVDDGMWQFNFAVISRALSQHRKSLRLLRLVYQPSSGFLERCITDTIHSLADMERLVALDLPEASMLPEPEAPSPVLASLLPPCLRNLVIRGCTRRIFSELHHLLAQPISRFSDLRDVTITMPRYVFDGKDSEEVLGEELLADPEKEYYEEWAQLKTAFEASGIILYAYYVPVLSRDYQSCPPLVPQS